MSTSNFVVTATLLGSLGLVTYAGATEQKPEPKRQIMTREELRVCLDLKSRVDALSAENHRLKKPFKAELVELKKMQAELAHDKTFLDAGNHEEVESFNARFNKLQALVDAHNQKIDPFNNRIIAFNSENAKFIKQCKGKDFRESDKSAILAGK